MLFTSQKKQSVTYQSESENNELLSSRKLELISGNKRSNHEESNFLGFCPVVLLEGNSVKEIEMYTKYCQRYSYLSSIILEDRINILHRFSKDYYNVGHRTEAIRCLRQIIDLQETLYEQTYWNEI